MNKFSLLLLLCFVFSHQAMTQGIPTPRQIGDAYIATTGGVEAWKSISAMRMQGRTTMAGVEYAATVIHARGNKSYVEIEAMGKKIIQAYDGNIAWEVMPLEGIMTPSRMSPEATAEFREQIFLSEFIDTETRGFRLQAVPGREFSGIATYGVRVTNAAGYDRTYYFDAEYIIPIMVAAPIKTGPQRGRMTETYLSSYDEVRGANTGSVLLPFAMEIMINGETLQQIHFEQITLNPRISASMFSMPRL